MANIHAQSIVVSRAISTKMGTIITNLSLGIDLWKYQNTIFVTNSLKIVCQKWCNHKHYIYISICVLWAIVFSPNTQKKPHKINVVMISNIDHIYPTPNYIELNINFKKWQHISFVITYNLLHIKHTRIMHNKCTHPNNWGYIK